MHPLALLEGRSFSDSDDGRTEIFDYIEQYSQDPGDRQHGDMKTRWSMKTATKVFIDLSLAIACLGCSWFANPARAQQTPPLSGNYREEVLLVKIMSPSAEKDALAALSDSIHQQIGAEVMEEYSLLKNGNWFACPKG